MRMRLGEWRLRPSIVVLFIAMVLPVFTAAIWAGYVSLERMARSQAEESVDRARVETIGHTEALVDPIASLVRVSSRLAAEQPEFFRQDRALPTMLEVLSHSPTISSVYVGFADGSYRMALRVPPKVKIHGKDPPPITLYANRWIDRSAKSPLEVYTFLDTSSQVLGTSTATTTYDPRVRAWYKDAVEKKGLITSNPYIYATTGLPGITVAMPFMVKGQVGGVVAIDILMDSLSHFLKARLVSPNSLSLIVDRDGLIVAHSDASQVLKRDVAGALSRVRINELKDPLPALAFGERGAHKQAQFNFMHRGDEYVAMFAPFPPEFGKAWDVVIVTPLEDFVGEASANNRQLLLMGLVAIGLQVLVIYALSRRIARPLEQLEQQVQDVQDFKTTHSEPVRSRIREISSLATSVGTLQGAITAFSAFVPRELVRQLIATGHKLELGGRSQFLTVMFTDLEAFSTLTEITPAQELLDRVSHYFDVVTRATIVEKGTLDKFIGDGVMAFWGAPAQLEDHAYHACVAALRIQRGMDKLNADYAERGIPPLRVRVGIHSDAVLVGNMGAPDRMSYTVMGDGVNLAARLEGTNKEFGTNICISHAVFREAGERLWIRRIGVVTVKGRRQDLQVYELMGLKDGDPELLATPQIIRLCEMTNKAYASFEDGDIGQARQRFIEITEAFPGDPLALAMIAKCKTTDDEVITV
ncbi:HAMP domain-containing protein [Caenimonas sedimenti]|uniref:HAMP domain-containing protein n=1 Tax=Caenimonas sedimenti TaxID=2596921 RepID=A0A562ZFI1_9BURK|nr:adenylate/guanylate cyclase domain-containing protein [Caenimonas sedimenti]TWO65519.1 HAMP domain-containing protein [Caenimonas sedimenti]